MFSTTLGGIAGLAAPRCLATIEAMAGYLSPSGFTRGAASRLPVWNTWFGS